jgi:hypothetical protein
MVIPELALDPVEAEAYGVAVRDVAKHYKITQKFVGKWADWTNLIGCLAMIYGPRYYLIRQRVNEQNLERRARMTPARQTAQPPAPNATPAANASPPSSQPVAQPSQDQSPNGKSTAAMPIPPLQVIDMTAFEEANQSPEQLEILRRARAKAQQQQH